MKGRASMRFLIKVTIPVEAGNKLVREGTLGETMGRVLNDLKPEAAYFTTDGGKRTGFIVADIKDPHQIPSIAEPWFLAFNASVEFHPAMTPEDLQKAGPDLARAAKTYS
jgi:hypothetical protein